MPSNKMERFTQRARQVLTLAQDYAERVHHNAIDSQHILMALFIEDGGIAARVLHDLGVELAPLQGAIEQVSPVNRPPDDKVDADLSQGSKRVLELAVDEARRMGHHYIGTEHLLLGVVRVEDGAGVQVLKHLGISPEEVRRQTRRLLQESPVQTNIPDRPTSARPRILPSQVKEERHVSTVYLSSLYLMESMIHKMLDMVGEGKLTVEQANEMLATMQPGLKLTAGMQAWFQVMARAKDAPPDKQVEIVVNNTSTGEILFEASLSMLEALEKFDQLLAMAPDNDSEGFSIESRTSPVRIVINVEKGSPKK